MRESLSDLIDAVIETTVPVMQSPIERARQGPCWALTDAGKSLVDRISSDPKFVEFDKHLQLLGNGASVTDLSQLADWLVERAKVVGGKGAERDLLQYLDSDEIEVYAIMLLADVYLNAEYKFCNNVEIINSTSLPNKSFADTILNDSFSSRLPLPRVYSLLVSPYSQKRFHWPNTESETKMPMTEYPSNALEETKLCLVLARSRSIQVIASGTIAPDHLPFIRSCTGWSMHSFKLPGMAPSILEIEMKIADELLLKLRKLPESFKIKLATSIERFNGYCSGASMVEKSIDLRICLESIFLSDGNKEQLRYTLALRSALFVGDSLEEKKEIMNIMKKSYDVTSTAVHEGKMPTKNVDLLPQAAKIARNSILKLLEVGPVDWQTIELQASID